jgi:hypothetical protein
VRYRGLIFLKKLTAGFLMMLLTAVTVIQVLHSHSYTTTSGNLQKKSVKKTNLPGYNKSTIESRCFICEYQLSKDADANYAILNIAPSHQYQITAKANYSFTFQAIYSFFETRGPPSFS